LKNIPFHKADITEEDVSSVSEVIRSGWLTMGQKTFDFEKSFVNDMKGTEAVGLNSGTAALHLSLICAGVGPGDEVIVPAITFASTANVIRMCGAKPVIVDVNRDTHLIDPDAVKRAITGKTRAIIPVHFAGQPCDMDLINDLAQEKDIKVIEDAAHAFPSLYKNKMVGSLGFSAAFSFYVTKTITSGEGPEILQ
jgi:dTDP-4-amino-4,6-dideoxygalactose transaminase